MLNFENSLEKKDARRRRSFSTTENCNKKNRTTDFVEKNGERQLCETDRD